MRPTSSLKPQTNESINKGSENEKNSGQQQPSRFVATQINKNGMRELPGQFEKCEVNDLIELVASMLNRLINHNDQIPLSPTSLTRFHSRSPPAIPIKDYLDRIYRYAHVEPICYILILFHIDKICENLSNFTICSLTVHRFAITSVTVSSKTICDSFYSNSRYAKVGGISLAEMNLLEREFLIAIDYGLMTSLEVLNKYYLSLIQSHPKYTLQPSSSSSQQSLETLKDSKIISESFIKDCKIKDSGNEAEQKDLKEEKGKQKIEVEGHEEKNDDKDNSGSEEQQIAFEGNVQDEKIKSDKELVTKNLEKPVSVSTDCIQDED